MGKFQNKNKGGSKSPKQRRTKPLSKKKQNKKFNKKEKRQNQQTQNQDNQNSLENSYGAIDRNKLLAMNSNKQIDTIKDIHQKIIGNPEQNIKHLDALFMLAKVPNLKVVAIVLRTMADIFVNVAPLESINLKDLEDRTQHKITKDEFVVIKFEKILIQQYERFIKILKQLKSKLKAQNFDHDKQMFREFKKCILQCALNCFKALWNFNFSKQLCDLLLTFMKFRQCQTCFEQLLKDPNIATVTIKVKIINGIAQLIKKKQDRQLPDNLIRILNSTYIDGRYLQREVKSLDFKKKKLKQRMYKQEAFDKKAQKDKGKDQKDDKLAQKRIKKTQKMKIKLKIKQEIDKQFAEGDAIISNKQIVRNNSLILQELFYVYFKVLVERLSSKFLKDALDGILTFAHLINVELIRDMIEHLNSAAKIFREIWKKTPNNQNLGLRLIIVFTMESILNGPLSVYNMDDVGVTSNFYKILRDINLSKDKLKINKQVFRLICITLEQTFIKRRQLSQQIVGSFLRQTTTILLRPELPKLCLLEFIRLVGSKYSKVSRMFQDDNEGYGINSYNQMCQDPQSTNAINTQLLTKLNSLKNFDKFTKSFQKQITEYLIRLNRQNFNRIDGTQSLQFILKEDLAVGF